VGRALLSKKTRKAAIERSPIRIARALVKTADSLGVDIPLTQALVAMADGLDPLEAVQALMGRRAHDE
jgi:glycerol-3-phosphate dehydrogenase